MENLLNFFKQSGLTKAQLTVSLELTGSKTNDQIAKDLQLSPKTVKTHTTAIYKKLGVNKRTQYILLCAKVIATGRP